jgi:hypothetical protein
MYIFSPRNAGAAAADITICKIAYSRGGRKSYDCDTQSELIAQQYERRFSICPARTPTS